MKKDTPFWLGLAGGTALAAFALHRSTRVDAEPKNDQQPGRRPDTKGPLPSGRPPGVPDSRSTPPPSEPPAPPSSPPSKVKLLPAVSRRYDAVFRPHAGVLPVAFLRALAQRESSMNANEQTGPAWGLLQVVEVVRRDFNKRHGTSYARTDLLDPEVNVRMSTELLHIIVKSYKRNHPDVPNLIMDWGNARFVELLVAGWNGGWSESAGLGRVARYLERRGQTRITIDDIFANARAAGAVRFLSEPARRKWSKSVARLYMSEALRDQSTRTQMGA